MVCICAPLGFLPESFIPGQSGADYTPSPYLEPFADFRKDFTVVSGLMHAGMSSGLGHQASASFLTGVPGASLGMCDETFAPVAYVNVFDTEAEAITRANDTTYGLAAYVFTRDLSRAFRLMETLEAGMIGINDGVPTTSNAPSNRLVSTVCNVRFTSSERS